MNKSKGNTDLTKGKVWKVIVRFALPLLIGNLLQQLYNVTDSVIVGQFLGKEALAAVSASFFHLLLYYLVCDRCRKWDKCRHFATFRG